MASVSSQAKGTTSVKDSTRAKSGIPASQRPGSQYNRLQDECKNVGDRIKVLKPNEPDKKELGKVFGPTGVRSLPSRSSQRRLYPTIMPKKELERLQKASKVITLEETVAEMERIEAEKKRIEDECENRKRQMREIDDAKEMLAKKDQTGESFEEEDKAKVLDRAFLLKHEQEEEVKQANRIILAAKCHLIRHAQIQEKHEMERELKEEEFRLEKQFEKERSKAFKGDDERVQMTKEHNMKNAIEIKRQLEEKERERQIAAEEIDAEAKMLAQAKAAIERDEEEQLNAKRDKTVKLRADLQKVSELSALYKKMEFDQEREAEMKVQEYMREKEEREKKLALERKLAKEALERKQERLLSLQQKAMQSKADLDDMTIRREQEEKEREFRRKAKEAAEKRKQIEKELIESRVAQLAEMKLRKALQMERDEADFKRICEKLKDEEAKDKEMQRLRLTNKCRYREEIGRQIREKQRERQDMQRRAKNEYLAWQEKEKLREKNIQKVIKNKVEAMRNANMPEKFIKDVEKQLNVATVN